MLNACAFSIYRNNVQINDAIRQNFVAFARGAMLDYLGELTGTSRLDGESDDAYRVRIPLRLEAHAAGGTAGYYRYQALSASPDVLDVSVVNNGAGNVLISLLSKTDTTINDDLLLVSAKVNSDEVRSLCDTITVQPANAIYFSITASIKPIAGYLIADVDVTITNAITQLNAKWRKLGQDIIPSQITAAIMATGMVERVELASPVFIEVNNSSYPVLSEVNLTWL
jgi:phage-related baseplate assembly protein